jgi:hypothetical protein
MDLTTEESHVTRSNSYWIPFATLAAAAILAACGSSSPATSSSSGSTPTAAPTAPPATAAPTVALPTTTTASSSCPSGSTVASALGTAALPNPTGIVGGGSTQLPAGATGIVCEYLAAAAGENVIVEVIQNIPSSYISAYSSKFPAAFKSVSGLGDIARSFSASIGGGKTDEGVVAAQGTTIVAVVATGTPASLSQIESLVSSLL